MFVLGKWPKVTFGGSLQRRPKRLGAEALPAALRGRGGVVGAHGESPWWTPCWRWGQIPWKTFGKMMKKWWNDGNIDEHMMKSDIVDIWKNDENMWILPATMVI